VKSLRLIVALFISIALNKKSLVIAVVGLKGRSSFLKFSIYINIDYSFE
jgi:hypothetical protein